jgi:hypothetical protein
MSIEIGQIVYVCTTGEPVFTLRIYNSEAVAKLGRLVAVRATGAAPGVAPTYPLLDFYEAELETKEESQERELEIFKSAKAAADKLKEAPKTLKDALTFGSEV